MKNIVEFWLVRLFWPIQCSTNPGAAFKLYGRIQKGNSYLTCKEWSMLRFWNVIFIVLVWLTFLPRFYIVVIGMTFFFIKLIYFFLFQFGLLFPFSLWTSISLLVFWLSSSLFSLDFFPSFLFGLLFNRGHISISSKYFLSPFTL